MRSNPADLASQWIRTFYYRLYKSITQICYGYEKRALNELFKDKKLETLRQGTETDSHQMRFVCSDAADDSKYNAGDRMGSTASIDISDLANW